MTALTTTLLVYYIITTFLSIAIYTSQIGHPSVVKNLTATILAFLTGWFTIPLYIITLFINHTRQHFT